VRIEACLWDPIADTQLRFVINDAGYEIREGRVRKNPRVPTEIAARIITDVGEREALVYSLSEGGAYLETPRAMAVGARLRIELPLPWVNIDIDARVLHSNVPGNLQQQNLALGMGVEFIDIDAETRAVIADYVDECLEYLTGRRSQKRTAAPRKEAKAGRIRETGASLVTKESPKPEHDLRNSGNQVIVRCRDGRLIKGYTFDFLPQKDVFHVVSPDDENEITELRSSDPTAIFFVKSFDANRDCAVQKNSTREQLRGLPGVKLEVRFLDGEVMHGTTHGYQPGREGFFLFPVDETSNNLRVYIYEESTESVTILR
jgi:hypothetical protein